MSSLESAFNGGSFEILFVLASMYISVTSGSEMRDFSQKQRLHLNRWFHARQLSPSQGSAEMKNIG